MAFDADKRVEIIWLSKQMANKAAALWEEK